MLALYLQRSPRILACILGTILLTSMPLRSASADDAKPVVSLSIDFGDGSELHFTKLAWSDNMTALDALSAAAKHKRGVMHKVRGSGSFAFVTEIDGQANEGGNGRNWIFQVNGKLAKQGAGSQQLAEGDRVQWIFSRYEEPQ